MITLALTAESEKALLPITRALRHPPPPGAGMGRENQPHSYCFTLNTPFRQIHCRDHFAFSLILNCWEREGWAKEDRKPYLPVIEPGRVFHPDPAVGGEQTESETHHHCQGNRAWETTQVLALSSAYERRSAQALMAKLEGLNLYK